MLELCRRFAVVNLANMESVMSREDVGLLKEFADESLESLSLLDGHFVQLERNPSHSETIQTVFRAFHNIKGNCAYFNLSQMKNITHELETFLNLVREKKVVLNSKGISVLLASSDTLKAMLADIKNGSTDSIGEDKVGLLIQKIRQAAGV